MSDHIYLDADRAASELCKRRLSYFVKQFWDEVIEDELEWSPHMDVLCNEIQAVYERVFLRQDPVTKAWYRLPKLYDLIVNIPPGTSKSTIATVMAPAWGWTRDPSLRLITGSFSESLSTEHAVKSRDIIRSAKYRRYFPEVQIKKDEDNKTDYKTTRHGQRYVTSTGGSPTGVHAHIQNMDDMLNPREAASESQLERAIHFFSQTLPSRKADKRVTPLILIMQRLHAKDPTGYLLEKKRKGIRLVCLPGTLSDLVSPVEYKKIYSPEGLLDPIRLPKSALEELKIELGTEGYSGQIDQSPVPPGGLIWKKEWFIQVPDEDWPSIQKGASPGSDWDLAYTKEDNNAASAYITSFKYNNRVFLDDFGWEWKEFPEMIKWMKTKPGPYYIEAKASGKSAKQVLTKQGIAAVEVKVKGGADKEARAKMATPMAEAGLVCIRKSMADRFFNDSRQGILFFPKGKFMDLADTLSQCLQRHNTAGFKYHNGQNEPEDGEDDDDLLDQLDY